MQNPYVQVSLGIILIGLSVLIAAFLIGVGVAMVSTSRNIANRERLKRLEQQREFLKQYHNIQEDDLK